MGNPDTAERARVGPGGDPPLTFEAFYRAHVVEVRQALCLALGDVDLGSEAADEALARACERWEEVRGFANPAGWAYRVGLNWALDHERRRRRWRDHRAVPDRPAVTIASDPTLEAALRGLPVEQRAVVVCRYLLDWSIQDTAAALDVPVGTVKSRMARALATLSRHLEEGR